MNLNYRNGVPTRAAMNQLADMFGATDQRPMFFFNYYYGDKTTRTHFLYWSGTHNERIMPGFMAFCKQEGIQFDHYRPYNKNAGMTGRVEILPKNH